MHAGHRIGRGLLCGAAALQMALASPLGAQPSTSRTGWAHPDASAVTGLSVGTDADDGDDGDDGALGDLGGAGLVSSAATGEAVILGALFGAGVGALLGATVFAPTRTVASGRPYRVAASVSSRGAGLRISWGASP